MKFTSFQVQTWGGCDVPMITDKGVTECPDKSTMRLYILACNYWMTEQALETKVRTMFTQDCENMKKFCSAVYKVRKTAAKDVLLYTEGTVVTYI